MEPSAFAQVWNTPRAALEWVWNSQKPDVTEHEQYMIEVVLRAHYRYEPREIREYWEYVEKRRKQNPASD